MTPPHGNLGRTAAPAFAPGQWRDVSGRRRSNYAPQPETLMLGYDPALSEGTIKPPVFLTSTLVFGAAWDRGTDLAGVAVRRGNRPSAATPETS